MFLSKKYIRNRFLNLCFLISLIFLGIKKHIVIKCLVISVNACSSWACITMGRDTRYQRHLVVLSVLTLGDVPDD